VTSPRHLDIEGWPRRAAFHFFLDYEDPWFSVCAPVDVTALADLCSADRELSFGTACLYTLLRAANECEAFRYRLDGGRVLVHDRVHVGTTTLYDDERLAFIYFDYDPDFRAFRDSAVRARRDGADDTGALSPQDGRTDLIHFSALPWIPFTSVTHPRPRRRGGSVPKVMWGRYGRDLGRALMPVSVEAHHGLMDGVHVGRYFQLVEALLADPAGTLGWAAPDARAARI
jgi:chloramphenicol O-acetyltransferase type A